MKRSHPSVVRIPRRTLAVLILIALGQAAALGVFLVLIRFVVDKLSNAAPLGEVHRLVAALAATVLLAAALRVAEFRVAEKMGYAVVAQLRMRMYDHLSGMSPRQLMHRSRGALLLRFTGDLSMTRTWISRGFARGVVSGLVVAGVVAVVGWINLRVAVGIMAVLLIGAAASIGPGERLSRSTRSVRRKRSLLTSNVAEQVSALASIQVFGRIGGERSRLDRQNESMTRSLFRATDDRATLVGIGALVGWAAVVVAIGLGAIEIYAGRMTIGGLVAAMSATRQIAGPVRRLGLTHDYWQRGRVSSRKIEEFLRSSSRSLEASDVDLELRGARVELRDVSVNGSLDHVSAVADRGQLVAVMGPNGAGKSTLVATVVRMLDPDEGAVLIDDQQVDGLSYRSLSRAIGVVSPDVPLLRGTLRRNLTYRQPNVSTEELQRIIRTCGLAELIDRLPDGLETWLVEGGRNLSAGERQRVSLARAVLGAPKILVLDEPTANLDTETRQAIRDVISRHAGTVFLVTHDVEEALLADQVWTLERGRLTSVLDSDDFRDSLWRDRHPRRLLKAHA